jgi:hypothetical protein
MASRTASTANDGDEYCEIGGAVSKYHCIYDNYNC